MDLFVFLYNDIHALLSLRHTDDFEFVNYYNSDEKFAGIARRLMSVSSSLAQDCCSARENVN